MLRLLSAVCVILIVIVLPVGVGATTYTTYVTGDTPTDDVVFEVALDPAIPFSATVVPVVTETRSGYRLDGIDFSAGNRKEVVVGTQIMTATPNGAITSYNVQTGATLLPDIVPSTNAVVPGPAPAASRPSSLLTTPFGYFYTENQFGFAAGAGAPHRIMSTPLAGPPGIASVVFDGSAPATALVNFEGLELVGSSLYFFAEDTGDPMKRALYSIGLLGGVWDGGAPSLLLGGLDADVPPGDGSDELDFDPGSGILFGSNQVSSEIIYWDTGLLSGGVLLPGGGGLGPKHALLDMARLDGIRVTPDGDYLVLTGLAGVIASVDIAGAFGGPGDEDINILYDSGLTGSGFAFDDLTPLFVIPEPSAFALGLLALVGWFASLRRRSGR